MIEKHKKALIVIAFSFIMLLLFLFIKPFFTNEDSYSVRTVLGDKFDVTCVSFIEKSTVTSANSDLSFNVRFRVRKEDFVPLACTSDLKMYKIGDKIIFDDGCGFNIFNEKSVDDNPEVVKVVKGGLLSGNISFENNIIILLNSKKYYKEAKLIIEWIKQDKYDNLYQYGLTEEVINDGYTIKYIKYTINDLDHNRQ